MKRKGRGGETFGGARSQSFDGEDWLGSSKESVVKANKRDEGFRCAACRSEWLCLSP